MPILLLDYNGVQRTVPFGTRLTMGRARTCDMVVDHPAISRTHAIFEHLNNSYVVTDMGSKNGIYVDDIRIAGRHKLRDGDKLIVGPSTVSFYSGDTPPERLSPPSVQVPVKASQAIESVAPLKDGVVIDCVCGTRLWIPREMIGGRGQCPKCRRSVELIDPDAPIKSICSICQWEIGFDQVRHICPNCGLIFHEDCWQENRGCSAYGCSQVGVLDRRDDDATVDLPAPFHHDEEIGHPPMHGHSEKHFPWEFAILGGSILLGLLGLLLFGALSIISGVVSVIYLVRNHHSVNRLAIYSAIGVSIIGLLAGLMVSQVFHFNRPWDSFLGH